MPNINTPLGYWSTRTALFLEINSVAIYIKDVLKATNHRFYARSNNTRNILNKNNLSSNGTRDGGEKLHTKKCVVLNLNSDKSPRKKHPPNEAKLPAIVILAMSDDLHRPRHHLPDLRQETSSDSGTIYPDTTLPEPSTLLMVSGFLLLFAVPGPLAALLTDAVCGC